jgi:hypothetical protein
MTKKEMANVKVGDRLYLQQPLRIGTGKYGKHIRLERGAKVIFRNWNKEKAVCTAPIKGTLFDNYPGVVSIDKNALMLEPKFIVSQL